MLHFLSSAVSAYITIYGFLVRPISRYISIMFLHSADLERGHRQLGEPTDAEAML
jgi:hypothetical protein